MTVMIFGMENVPRLGETGGNGHCGNRRESDCPERLWHDRYTFETVAVYYKKIYRFVPLFPIKLTIFLIKILPYLIHCFFNTNLARADMILNHKEFKYFYEKVPIFNKNNEIDYYGGQIRIEDTNGRLVYFSLTGYTPGCGEEMQPITLLTVTSTNFPRLKKDKEKEYIMFCGNTDGHHNVIRIFQPYLSMVAAMDFMDGPVDFSRDSDGVYSAKVHYTIYSNSLNSQLTYPVYYRLEKSGTTISFSSQFPTSISDTYYKKYIDDNLRLFTDYNTRKYGYSALLVAIQTGNEEKLCLSINKIKKLLHYSEFEKIWKFVDENINNNVTVNLLRCEEN